MYDELVKRLRNRRICIQQSGSLDDFPLLREAADAIEELQEDNAALNGTVTNLLEQIKDLRKPRWIPVTERLPELNKEVLVYAVGKIDGFIGSSVFALSERFLFKFFPSSKGTEEWRSPWQYFMTDYEITHWMPLPEPPKEES